MLTVRCPKCKQMMKTAPRVKVTEAVKRCVYCGHSFKIHINLRKSRIVRDER